MADFRWLVGLEPRTAVESPLLYKISHLCTREFGIIVYTFVEVDTEKKTIRFRFVSARQRFSIDVWVLCFIALMTDENLHSNIKSCSYEIDKSVFRTCAVEYQN